VLECRSDSVLVSALKLAEDQPSSGKAYILRLYETHGLSGAALLRFGFPLHKIVETDLTENEGAELPLDGNPLQLLFSHHEVKTFKFFC